MDLILQLFQQVGLVVGFAIVAIVALRLSADEKMATTLAARIAMQFKAMPPWLRGNEWAYSATALRWFALDIGLASLNFVLIGLHLTPLVFVSVACFLLSVLVASGLGFTHVVRQKGVATALLREIRFWEFLAWVLILLYTLGVLLLAKTVL